MTTAQTIDDNVTTDILSRLADALSSTNRIDGLARLMADAEAALVTAGDEAEKQRRKSLDVSLSFPDAMKAKSEAEAGAFYVSRLQMALEQLEVKAQALAERDRKAKHETARQQAEDAVAAAVERIRTEYGPAARTLVSLLADIVKADALVARANASKGGSDARLSGPDGMARRFTDLGVPLPASDTVLRLVQMVLPHPDDPTKALWPPVPLYRLKDCNGVLSHDTVAAILRGIADAERR